MGKELPSHVSGAGKVSYWLIGISQPFGDKAKPLHMDSMQRCSGEPLAEAWCSLPWAPQPQNPAHWLVGTFTSPQTPTELEQGHLVQVKTFFC